MFRRLKIPFASGSVGRFPPPAPRLFDTQNAASVISSSLRRIWGIKSSRRGIPMTNTSLCRVGLLALLVVVSSSCHDTTPPTTVSPTQPTPVAPPPPPPPPPPPVPRGGPFPGAGTYAFVSSPSGRAVYPYTADSHYVLYDDGTFALRSPSSSFEVRKIQVRERARHLRLRLEFPK